MSDQIQQQKDLVLNPNEFAYLLDRTKGIVNCYVGPTKTSLSNTDAPVVFDTRSKRFVECYLDNAIQTFVTAPENWYCVLKNPAPNGKRPTPRSVNELPDLEIGKKVNIAGPVSFALYPGQMARVIQGHRLRSNQYLLIRVYDEDSARKNWNNSVIRVNTNPENALANNPTHEQESSNSENLDSLSEALQTQIPESKSIGEITADDLTVGKIMVIKGTEVSFYIPPTGIEVMADHQDVYVRDAVTLERLEYCILKDEDGNRRYVHGPAVVFPEPTETFVSSGNGYKFKAIELSKISGIYVKVIAEYDDERGEHHNIGEELFITGNEQMIYYPRPEHAIITYEGRVVHHAIAIPAGEGRYVMNRMTGEISTERGPAMFLPDPRNQVIVKRKLTTSQARLWYPGNREVAEYNERLGTPEEQIDDMDLNTERMSLNKSAVLEPGSLLNRSNTFTPPRTIIIDSKFDGVVSIDVWTGYAINVISKDGTRKVVVGPCTYLMGYDETLEILELSTGKPKTTDELIRTTFLRVDNNKISDIINVETKDFVTAEIKVSYSVSFERSHKDNWFSVENYVKYLCDRIRSLLKREVKNHTVEEFYQHSTDIVRQVALNLKKSGEENDGHNGRFFNENGMLLTDVDVLSIRFDASIAELLREHQYDTILKTIELSDADQRKQIAEKLAQADQAIAQIKHDSEVAALELRSELEKKQAEYEDLVLRLKTERNEKEMQIKLENQKALDSLNTSELARIKAKDDQALARDRSEAENEKFRRDAYAESVKTIIGAISPQLSASIETLAETSNLACIAEKMSPLAIAGEESVADVTNRLLRGTTMEDVLRTVSKEHPANDD